MHVTASSTTNSVYFSTEKTGGKNTSNSKESINTNTQIKDLLTLSVQAKNLSQAASAAGDLDHDGDSK
ncbi:MAG: hypothetical protein NT007_11665 [Candidatus Kapabacteria bacterium]|nr:hypothetical protein [Candidatus Kapabacteria bacterium]